MSTKIRKNLWLASAAAIALAFAAAEQTQAATVLLNGNFSSATIDTGVSPGAFDSGDEATGPGDAWVTDVSTVGAVTIDTGVGLAVWSNPSSGSPVSTPAGIWQVVDVSDWTTGEFSLDYRAEDTFLPDTLQWYIALAGFAGPFTTGNAAPASLGVADPLGLAGVSTFPLVSFSGDGSVAGFQNLSASVDLSGTQYLVIAAYAEGLASSFSDFAIGNVSLIPEPGTMVLGAVALFATVIGINRKRVHVTE